MSSLKLQGRITYIGSTVQVTEKFSKREFAIETEDVSNNGTVFTNTVALQFTNKQTPILDNFSIGQNVEVSFNARSNRNDKDGVVRFFTNLNAYAMQFVAGRQQAPQQAQQPAPAQVAQAEDDSSDLPF